MNDEIRYLRTLVSSLRNDIDRLHDRVTMMENVMFALGPSQMDENIDSIEAVRFFLRKSEINSMSAHVVRFIEDRLTVDWRDLIKRKGYKPVFTALAHDRSIVEARKMLA